MRRGWQPCLQPICMRVCSVCVGVCVCLCVFGVSLNCSTNTSKQQKRQRTAMIPSSFCLCVHSFAHGVLWQSVPSLTQRINDTRPITANNNYKQRTNRLTQSATRAGNAAHSRCTTKQQLSTNELVPHTARLSNTKNVNEKCNRKQYQQRRRTDHTHTHTHTHTTTTTPTHTHSLTLTHTATVVANELWRRLCPADAGGGEGDVASVM